MAEEDDAPLSPNADVIELREAVLRLSARTRSLGETVATFNAIGLRQQRIEKNATDALNDARQALDEIRTVDSKIMPRWEIEARQQIESARRERIRQIWQSVAGLLIAGIIAGGFLLHRANQAASQAQNAAKAEQTNTAALKQRLVTSCEGRNHTTDVQREYYRRLLVSYQKDTSLPPDAQAARLSAINYVRSSLPPNVNCQLLAK